MHTQSNFSLKLPCDPNFKPPQTKAEFESMGYREKAQLQEEYPDIYKRFTNPRPWE